MITVITPLLQTSNIIPETFRKGKRFEDYVRRYLFPKENYKLIYRGSGHVQNAKECAGTILKPDFKFQDISTKKTFYLDCLFRTALITNCYQLSKAFQQGNDQKYKDADYFLLLGLGGKPELPNQVFLLKLVDCQYIIIQKRHLATKEIQTNQPVSPLQLWQHMA